MKEYCITVIGCDDQTEVHMMLTEKEHQLMTHLMNLINSTSTYGCMPRMSIEEYTKEQDKDAS